MTRRKRQRIEEQVTLEQESWSRPFSLVENLEESVKSLTSSNDTLKSTISALRSVTLEFNRQCEIVQYDKNYELVTETDIKTAQTEISKDFNTDLEVLLAEADLLLQTLKMEEDDLTLKLEEQEAWLKEKRASKTKAAIQQQQQQPTRAKPVSAAQSQRSLMKLEKLKKRKQRLLQLNSLEEEKIIEETKELKALHQDNLYIEKQLEVAAANSDQHGTEIDRGNMKLVLMQELSDLKRQAAEKQQAYDQKKLELEQLETSKPETNAEQSQEPRLSITESITQYSSHLELIRHVLNKLLQPHFIDTVNAITVKNCNTQCKRYLQGLQKEIEGYPPQLDDFNQEHWITQIKSLCKALMPDHILGKTAGRVLELFITKTKIPIEELFIEFPPTKEKRHHITQVTRILFDAHIIEISGTDLIITK